MYIALMVALGIVLSPFVGLALLWICAGVAAGVSKIFQMLLSCLAFVDKKTGEFIKFIYRPYGWIAFVGIVLLLALLCFGLPGVPVALFVVCALYVLLGKDKFSKNNPKWWFALGVCPLLMCVMDIMV